MKATANAIGSLNASLGAVRNGIDDPTDAAALGAIQRTLVEVGLAIGAGRKTLKRTPDLAEIEPLARLAETYDGLRELLPLAQAASDAIDYVPGARVTSYERPAADDAS